MAPKSGGAVMTIDTPYVSARCGAPGLANLPRIRFPPEEFFQALGRARKAARGEIERLIGWLDSMIDQGEGVGWLGDPAEDGGDYEPRVGSTEAMKQTAWGQP